MRARWLGGWIAAAALVLAGADQARAQWNYPYGYGAYGWGGWNSIGNVYGSYARGLGWLAVGEGVYNLDSAQARSINVNTNMRLNEYLYESLLQHDRRLWASRQKDRRDDDALISETQDRLRNSPTPNDVRTGDALNVALTELTDPRYASHVAQVASGIEIRSDLLKQIPFRNAVEAVTISFAELASGDLPKVFGRPEFADGVRQYREIVAKLDGQAVETGKVDAATVRQLRDMLQQGLQHVKAENDQAARLEAERYLRTLLALSYMLEGPSLDVYLAGVEDAKDLSLAKLLVFMQSFNLRFGPAEDPNQVQANQAVYALLTQARDEAFGAGTGTLPASAPRLSDRASRPGEFFGHLDDRDLGAAASGRPKAAAPR